MFVGRKAGVAAEETRAVLLDSAAKVFARRGYDGASISEITSEAGLTSGAVYAHYASKAELFVATLRTHGARQMDQLLAQANPTDLLEVITSIGSDIDHREPEEESLLVTAVLAARAHPEVAELLTVGIAQREEFFAAVLQAGQDVGTVTGEVRAETVARLALIISVGSLLVGAFGLEPTDHEDWARLMARLVGAFRA